MNVVVEHSKSVYVESGVPQGIVLEPLLFLCHINDLPDSVTSNVRLFADDFLLYRTIKSQEDHYKLQNDLISLEKWASIPDLCTLTYFDYQSCFVCAA